MSNTLFSGNIVWGYKPGSHLPHILDGNNGTPIVNGGGDYRRVTQNDIYQNAGDEATREQFVALAQRINSDYQASADPSFRKVMQSIKTYLTAGGRSDQQKALANVKKKVDTYYRKLEKAGTLGEDDGKRIGHYHDLFCSPEKNRFSGDLKLDPQTVIRSGEGQNHFRVPNPGGTTSGALGMWVKTDEALFPHEPSPNDIKEGIGTADCFMLSAMTQMAGNDPKKIRDAMRDNGDGTVTVRFYNKTEPVYITVEKSVNRFLGAGNLYASGSLWVQMMEKAYIGYCNKIRKEPLSYQTINYSTTHKFMNVVEPDKVKETEFSITHTYDSQQWAFGKNWGKAYTDRKDKSIFDTRRNGYLRHEDDFYHFLKEHINENKEVITVGNSGSEKDAVSFVKARGIRARHAYAVNKVFEQEVDDGKGHKMKKKFVQIRDPYGMFRAKYNERGVLVDDSKMFSGTANAGTDNMGTTNLELVDFLRCFDSFSGMKATAKDDYEKKVNAPNDVELSRLARIADDPARAADYAREIARRPAAAVPQQPQGPVKKQPQEQKQVQEQKQSVQQVQQPQEGADFLADEELPPPDPEKQRLSGFVELGDQLNELKRTTMGVERADSPEMARVKAALRSIRMAEKAKNVSPEVSGKLLKNLQLATKQYLTAPGKNHNDRWKMVSRINKAAEKQLEQILPSEQQKQQAAALTNILTEKGLKVPPAFEKLLATLGKNRQAAFDGLKMHTEAQSEKTLLQIGDEIKQISVYDMLKTGIEKGQIGQEELNYLSEKTPFDLYSTQGTLKIGTQDMGYLTSHDHSAKWVNERLLNGEQHEELQTDVKMFCSVGKAKDIEMQKNSDLQKDEWDLHTFELPEKDKAVPVNMGNI